MEKKLFEKPAFEVICFGAADIVCASGKFQNNNPDETEEDTYPD